MKARMLKSPTGAALGDFDRADDPAVALPGVDEDVEALAVETTSKLALRPTSAPRWKLGSVDPLDADPLLIVVLVVVAPADVSDLHDEGVPIHDLGGMTPEMVHVVFSRQDGFDRLCPFTWTGFGPGFGEFLGGDDGVDRLCGFTPTFLRLLMTTYAEPRATSDRKRAAPVSEPGGSSAWLVDDPIFRPSPALRLVRTDDYSCPTTKRRPHRSPRSKMRSTRSPTSR